MLLHTFRSMLGAAALLVAAQAAQATTVQCSHCNEGQMQAKAKSLGAGGSPHIVWNPVNGEVRRYRVYCGSAPNATDSGAKSGATTQAGCTFQAEDLQVSADLVTVAEAMSQIWNQTGGTFKAQINANVTSQSFPAYLPNKPSAHDFQRDAQLRYEILNLASTSQIFQLSNTPLAGPVVQLLAHIDAFTAMTQGVFVSVDIVFADGSKVTVMVKLNENATYVANSAVDSSGHTLVDPNYSTPAYPGRWYFPPGQGLDMAAFIEYMRSLGVTITSGSANGGVITCNWNPANNTTTCVVPN